MKVVAWKRKGVFRVWPIVVDAPSDADVDVVFADVVSKGKSTAKDKS